MRITKRLLEEAVERNVLSSESSTLLWEMLEARQTKSSFGFNVLAYLGALIIIFSLTWFAVKAFSELNSAILLTTAVFYFFVFNIIGLILQKKVPSQIPWMLLITFASFMVPLVIFAIQKVLGFYITGNLGANPDIYVWIYHGWFFVEVGTILIYLGYLIVFKFEFLVFPFSFFIWLFSMDLTQMILGKDSNWDDRKMVSIVFGLAMIAISYVLDLLRKEKDYSFWLYLFGLMSFWFALTFSSTDELFLKFLYCGMNLMLIFIAVIFRRTVFLVFGAMGVFIFLYDITNSVFRNSLLFPIYLSLVGAGILFGAVLLIKNQEKLEARFAGGLPGFLKRLIPKR